MALAAAEVAVRGSGDSDGGSSRGGSGGSDGS